MPDTEIHIPTPEELDPRPRDELVWDRLAPIWDARWHVSVGGSLCCPICHRAILTDDISVDMSIDSQIRVDQYDKMRRWTVAQLLAFRQLVGGWHRYTFVQMLDLTSWWDGTVFVQLPDLLIGIEPDGYTHS